MKKIHLRESQIIFESRPCAGTDTVYYEDEKSGEEYCATWDCDFGFPFGYWDVGGGHKKFFMGDAYSTHINACGKAVKEYICNVKVEYLEEELGFFLDDVEDLVSDIKEYGYTYNEENDLWVSQDGSDEIDIDEWIAENNRELPYDDAKKIVMDAINNGDIPNAEELAEEIVNYQVENEYDFTEREGINIALEDCGCDFEKYFQNGYGEGRIWPNLKMIGFYVSEQPSPKELIETMGHINDCGIESYENLMEYVMVFEDSRNDWEVTACTLSDYIDGNYGPEEEEDDDDYDSEEEIQYSRGDTKFVPHLANQEQKREYFKNFRDTRDKAVYAPKERAAGNLAAYHAMRYPYGENKRNKKNLL